MKLTYRGKSYDYNPPEVEYGDLNQSGKYRGLDVRFRNPKRPLVLQPTLDLLYRGVAYKNNEVEESPASVPVEAEVTKAPTLSVQDRARMLMMSHHRRVKHRQQAMLSRLDVQVGLPSGEASQFWNHVQGKVHPSFGDTYDRSQASLS
ncbi:DUF4278 domain-containing protein [Egbenema bharatensis]|uniref:DUF4278 domain-containing protein n=1 Tax=Egbenema bharatensis TaxID=3463334 RepID=UPI003A8AFFD4